MTLKSKLLAIAASAALMAGPALAQQSPQSQSRQGQGQGGWQQQSRAPSQYTRESGRIVQVRQVRVRGEQTPNHLVVVETSEGRRLVADLGQNVRNMDLRRGSQIQLRGEVVRVGPRHAVLLADAARIGGRTFDLDRPAIAMMPQRGGSASGGN